MRPRAGDDLVLSVSTRSPSNNDFPAGTTFNSLTLGNFHVPTGNGIALNAGITSSGGNVSLGYIELNAPQTFTMQSGGAGTIQSAAILTNGHTLTLTRTRSWRTSPPAASCKQKMT